MCDSDKQCQYFKIACSQIPFGLYMVQKYRYRVTRIQYNTVVHIYVFCTHSILVYTYTYIFISVDLVVRNVTSNNIHEWVLGSELTAALQVLLIMLTWLDSNSDKLGGIYYTLLCLCIYIILYILCIYQIFYILYIYFIIPSHSIHY